MRLGLAIGLVPFALVGCKTTGDAGLTSGDIEVTGSADPKDVEFVPANEPMKAGFENFKRGDYGLAERHLRDAVERNPRNTQAWIVLAASYDRLTRFDLADRAYGIAIGLSGETAEILNNQGYSYMLRGNRKAARAKLAKAYKIQPDNPTILNNLKLLDSSEQIRVH